MADSFELSVSQIFLSCGICIGVLGDQVFSFVRLAVVGILKQDLEYFSLYFLFAQNIKAAHHFFSQQLLVQFVAQDIILGKVVVRIELLHKLLIPIQFSESPVESIELLHTIDIVRSDSKVSS